MSGVWTAVAAGVGAVGGYLSSREQKKAAEAAAKPRETYQYHLPYMQEYISKIAPYILAEQQRIYESRLKQYGLNPGNFSPIASMLAGISPGYSGVGYPGSPVITGGGGYNPYQALPGGQGGAGGGQFTGFKYNLSDAGRKAVLGGAK